MKGVGFLRDFRFLLVNFGFLSALSIRLLPVIKSFLYRNYYYFYNEAILRYLKNDLKEVISKYKSQEMDYMQPCALNKSDIIWVCWWQGEENMPEIIQRCYQILQTNANGHPLILISKNNYSNYIDLPKYILDKVSKGHITLTHFSDIIRVTLLAKYGGFWIDAAIWVTSPIEINGFRFFSLKQKETDNGLVSKCRWTGGCMASGKENILYHFMRDAYFSYWEKHNVVIDYLLMDYLIDIAYSNFEVVQSLIDDLEPSCPNLHVMKQIMNDEYNKKTMDHILQENSFLSLSWKKKFYRRTENGNPTYYAFLWTDFFKIVFERYFIIDKR